MEYNNTTGAPVEAGGMGVIGGLFIPAQGQAWPTAVKSDTLYAADARHYLRLKAEPAVGGHVH